MFISKFNGLTEINESYLMVELQNAIRRNGYVSDSTITASWGGRASCINLTIDGTTNFTIEYSEYAATLYDWDNSPVLFGVVERDGVNFEKIFAFETICAMEHLA